MDINWQVFPIFILAYYHPQHFGEKDILNDFSKLIIIKYRRMLRETIPIVVEKPEVDEKAGEDLEEDLDEDGSGGSSEDEDEDKEGDVRM